MRRGAAHLILTDEYADENKAAIPMVLAAGAVHTYLVKSQLRTFTSLNVRSAEVLDVHNYAVLIGVGVTSINAYLAQEAIADRHARGLLGDLSLEQALRHYQKAINDGLMKIMSKMGISIVSSYRGGYNFEAVGLSRSLVGEFFPGLPSRISGIGLTGIQSQVGSQHQKAYDNAVLALPMGGFYRYRRGGETHAWEANLNPYIAVRGLDRFLRHLSQIYRRHPEIAAGGAARSSGF